LLVAGLATAGMAQQVQQARQRLGSVRSMALASATRLRETFSKSAASARVTDGEECKSAHLFGGLCAGMFASSVATAARCDSDRCRRLRLGDWRKVGKFACFITLAMLPPVWCSRRSSGSGLGDCLRLEHVAVGLLSACCDQVLKTKKLATCAPLCPRTCALAG